LEARVGRDRRRECPVPRQPRRRRRRATVRAGGRGGGERRLPRVSRRRRHPVLEGDQEWHKRKSAARGGRAPPAPRPAAGRPAAQPNPPLLPRQGGGDRLQEHPPPPSVHLGEGQDPLPPDHGCLPAPPGAGRGGGETRPRDGPPPLRLGQLGMQVILLQDVEKVGLRGEVVDVARGYARNYLLPRRLAETATPAKVAELEKRAELRARQEASTFEQARELGAKLEAAELRLEVKAGPTGSLFGSVTPTDLADEIWRVAKIRVDRRKIALGEAVKQGGRTQGPAHAATHGTAPARRQCLPDGCE